MDVSTSPFTQPQNSHVPMPFIKWFKFTNTSSSHPLSSLLFTSILKITIPSLPWCPNVPFSFPNYMYLPVPASCPRLSADIFALLIQVCHHSGFLQMTAPPRCALSGNQQPLPPALPQHPWASFSRLYLLRLNVPQASVSPLRVISHALCFNPKYVVNIKSKFSLTDHSTYSIEEVVT